MIPANEPLTLLGNQHKPPHYPLNGMVWYNKKIYHITKVWWEDMRREYRYALESICKTSRLYGAVDVSFKPATFEEAQNYMEERRISLDKPMKKPLKDFQYRLNENCDLLAKTLIEKNTKYKDSFSNTMNKYGDTTILIRLSDKMERLEAFIKDGQAPLQDENFLDTLLDIAGYAILAKSYYEEKVNAKDSK